MKDSKVLSGSGGGGEEERSWYRSELGLWSLILRSSEFLDSDVPLHSSDAPVFTFTVEDTDLGPLSGNSPVSSTTIKDSGVRSGSGGGISSSILGEFAITAVSWFRGIGKLVGGFSAKESRELLYGRKVVEDFGGEEQGRIVSSCFSGKSRDILEPALLGDKDEKLESSAKDM